MLLINRVGRYEFPVIKANRQKKHKPNSRVGGGGRRTQALDKPLSCETGWSIRGHLVHPPSFTEEQSDAQATEWLLMVSRLSSD